MLNISMVECHPFPSFYMDIKEDTQFILYLVLSLTISL